MSCRTGGRLLIAASVLLSILPLAVQAQQQPAEPAWPQPVENDRSFGYALLNQNELRVGSTASYRWDGEGWYGDDFDRLWVKSEGSVDTSDGTREEVEVQGLYSRAVSGAHDSRATMTSTSRSAWCCSRNSSSTPIPAPIELPGSGPG